MKLENIPCETSRGRQRNQFKKKKKKKGTKEEAKEQSRFLLVILSVDEILCLCYGIACGFCSQPPDAAPLIYISRGHYRRFSSLICLKSQLTGLCGSCGWMERTESHPLDTERTQVSDSDKKENIKEQMSMFPFRQMNRYFNVNAL